MESITRKTASSILSRCLSQPRLSSLKTQQCRFKSGASSLAAKPSTNAILQQNSAAALLGLDNASESAAEASSYQEALRASRQRFEQSAKAKEERRMRERDQQGIERLMARKWQGGDLYTPHDLTPREVSKFARTTSPSKDIFDALGINPLDAYKNPVLLAEFMTSGGKIKHRSQTGLRPVNQRKLAKTIRRAIGLGLMPSCHVHPEMLRRFGPDQNSRKYRWR